MSRETRLKRVFEVLDLWGPARRPKNRYLVEPARAVLHPSLEQEVPRGAFDSSNLRNAKRFLEILSVVAGSTLDLDEYQRIAVRADQVDLPGTATVVSYEHTKPATSKIPGRRPLTTPTERVSAVTPTRPPTQARKPSCDECEVHGPSVPCQYGDAGRTASRVAPGRDAAL